MKNYVIYDKTPPQAWGETIPIGCGRMGATLMAEVEKETLYLNEETIWSENRDNAPNPAMPEKIKAIKELFLKGLPVEANRLAATTLSDCFHRICSYEGAGKLYIELHEGSSAANYSHKLDLVNGIATVEYSKSGSRYKREYFASRPDNVIACRVTSSSAPLNAFISYERDRILSLHASENELVAHAKTLFGDHKFCTKIRVVTDGTVRALDGQLQITDTTSFCVYISIATEFRHGKDYEDATTFPSVLDYDAIRARHVKDFSGLMSRADVTLPSIEGVDELPIYEHFRLRWYNKPKDESLLALQWQFGRYLLASSSREGTLPANLQGLWTEGNAAGWSCDYHTNINLQANYWAAETVNLSECHLPLFDYMNEYLLESGKKTAKTCYGARGCVVHHLSDIYGYTAPADGLWGLWPHGASWLALHMWEHYLFTKDEAFLRDEAYEFFHQASLFFLDTLFPDDKGHLLYAPSTSPENHYFATDANGNRASCYLTMSSTMDVELITNLFNIYLESSEILGIDSKDVSDVREARAKLPPLSVGKHGQLMEWIEDYDEVEPGHRHTSHSFALFPASLINRSTPELCRALEVTINRRLASSNDNGAASASDVGWSMAWLGGAYARLRQADKAYSMIFRFVNSRVKPNLWDNIYVKSMGGDIFQIDGNLGYVAAMSEMLIQSHESTVAIIPAIPERWHTGSFRGLCARGGYEIDAAWENRDVKRIAVKAKFAGECPLELPATQKTLTFRDENGNLYTAKENILTVPVRDGLVLTAVE